ncbi:MAG: excinuclease ATPase [Alphaproteobacteria bacterium]|nr:excinuclease ATPase [Alphaproteobacteria bacterium]
MKPGLAGLALAAIALCAPAAHARKDFQTYSIDLVVGHPDYAEKIGDFKFVFGDAVSGQQIGSTSTRKSTNGLNKSDEGACVWAMLSALIAFKADAIARNGTSVQGVKSNVTGEIFSSATEFQCISGFTNSRVYLEGVVVK